MSSGRVALLSEGEQSVAPLGNEKISLESHLARFCIIHVQILEPIKQFLKIWGEDKDNVYPEPVMGYKSLRSYVRTFMSTENENRVYRFLTNLSRVTVSDYEM